jgi:general secretion pathway protein G
MLLVLVILAVLAAIVIPKFSGRSQQAKETAAKSQISSIELALDAFEVDTGAYPQGTGGLNALVDEPSGTQSWKGPYLKKGVPADPWGNAYIYTYPGKNNPKGYDLMSMGPDGRSGTDDDINNWDDRK